MDIKIIHSSSANGKKTRYKFDWGRREGQQRATKIWTHKRPKDLIEKNFNAEQMAILQLLKAQLITEFNAKKTEGEYIPDHIATDKKELLKGNFLEFMDRYVEENTPANKRTLPCAIAKFKAFVKDKHLAPDKITKQKCEQFRNHLYDTMNGEGGKDYFAAFKRMLVAAVEEGYFTVSPALHVKPKSKTSKRKDILSLEEIKTLLKHPCSNAEVRNAATVSLYTGLRWCDVSKLDWKDVKQSTIKIMQSKTGEWVEIPLHSNAVKALGEPKGKGLVFNFPTQDGANKVLRPWVTNAKINKHITWHGLRHTCSVLLHLGVDVQTVAGMLGHKSTFFVQKTYQRYDLTKATDAIKRLRF